MMTFYHRRLPHWHPPGQDIFITWRLYGSLPKQMTSLRRGSSSGETFVHYDRILDEARSGPKWLKDSRISECVLESIHEGHQRNMFRLKAYTLMPNHVHVLLTPTVPLAKIMQQIKGVTARRANVILNRTDEPFWQDESFDHWVRNAAEGEKIRSYIERNPVVAGLVARPQDWAWSSTSNPIL
jgi:putative transposase